MKGKDWRVGSGHSSYQFIVGGEVIDNLHGRRLLSQSANLLKLPITITKYSHDTDIKFKCLIFGKMIFLLLLS